MAPADYLLDVRRRLLERVQATRPAYSKWPAQRQGALIFVLALLLFNAFGALAYLYLAGQGDPARLRAPFLWFFVLGNFLALGFNAWALDSLLSYVARGESGEAWLKRDHDALQLQVQDLSQDSREMALFSQFAQMLQACANTPELCNVVTSFGKDLFPLEAGALYVTEAGQPIVASQISWGDPPSPDPFMPQDCWGIRLAKPHYWESSKSGLFCSHVSPPLPAYSLCLPLSALGINLGLLHFRAHSAGGMSEARQRFATTFANQVALGLSNLRLRESLREEAIRDPLTDLFNRRFMKESLDHEILRAQRDGNSLGVIAVDLDHFKEINDKLGHATGDAVLRGISTMARHSIRAGDISCRQGGDEFLFILPEASEEDCLRLAEKMRTQALQVILQVCPSLAGAVTLSCGMAMFPKDAQNAESLLKAADLAMYQAKTAGRDRVIAASSLPRE